MTPSGAGVDEVTIVRGPYFDELEVGMEFAEAPAVDLTEGMQAVHRAIVGGRMRLALDSTLSRDVANAERLASPALVWDVSIGQSTIVTQHVIANLFYRGLVFRRFPVLGDTLVTRTTVEALKANTRRPGRERTGLAALHIVTADQLGRTVLDYWRCAMLPLSSADAPVDSCMDDLDQVGPPSSPSDYAAPIEDWNLDLFRERVIGPHYAGVRPGHVWRVDGADLVSSAPELARLTGNVASVHHDSRRAGGERLVYGGHTIGLAFHQLMLALPAAVTVVGWSSCDHLAPVREGDRLTSTITAESVSSLARGGRVLAARVQVEAHRGDGGAPIAVLDWRPLVVLS